MKDELEKYLQMAAQCWCNLRTSKTLMDPDLATVFAEKLLEVERETKLKTIEMCHEYFLLNQCSSPECNCQGTVDFSSLLTPSEKNEETKEKLK